jgi:hypothetical protein
MRDADAVETAGPARSREEIASHRRPAKNRARAVLWTLATLISVAGAIRMEHAPAAFAGATAPPMSKTDDCGAAPARRTWLTDAGCVSTERCPGVPGPCKKTCVPFPKACDKCASCNCVGRAVCGDRAVATCKGRTVQCNEP